MALTNQNGSLQRAIDLGLRVGRFKLLGREEGTSLLETALAFTILMPLLLGAFEFSLALYTYQDVADAARVAARWAAVRGSESCANEAGLNDCNATAVEIRTFVRGLNYPALVSSNLGATATWSSASTTTPTTWTACAGTCNNPGNRVTVTVTYSFPLSIPFWRVTSISITSTGSMVISQ
jgi:Flp pilus assembly protein TadG